MRTLMLKPSIPMRLSKAESPSHATGLGFMPCSPEEAERFFLVVEDGEKSSVAAGILWQTDHAEPRGHAIKFRATISFMMFGELGNFVAVPTPPEMASWCSAAVTLSQAQFTPLLKVQEQARERVSMWFNHGEHFLPRALNEYFARIIGLWPTWEQGQLQWGERAASLIATGVIRSLSADTLRRQCERMGLVRGEWQSPCQST